MWKPVAEFGKVTRLEPVLSLAGRHDSKKDSRMQVRPVGCRTGSFPIASPLVASLDNSQLKWCLVSPCRHNENQTIKPRRHRRKVEVLHLFRWFTHTHPTAVGYKTKDRTWDENENDKEMEVRWEWKWDEKLLNENTRRGTQKKKGKRKHQHQHTWPGTGKPWKGKGKEKRRPTDNKPDQRRGGGRKRLNKPDKAKPKAYLSTNRTKPT